MLTSFPSKVSIAMTGSGKTMGYMLPAIIHCMNQVIGQIILFSGRKLIMGNLDVLGQYFFQLVNLFDEMLSRPT